MLIIMTLRNLDSWFINIIMIQILEYQIMIHFSIN